MPKALMMANNKGESVRIAVCIPCYRTYAQILDVLKGINPAVDRIFVIDDACPEQTGQRVEAECSDPRIRVIYHPVNQGVGAAMLSGYRAALADGAGILVKMDGDGQMDPACMGRLVHPLLNGKADFTKGNRFYDFRALQQMPWIRRIGNLGLTLLTKAASGFWHISDPTNGYTAVRQEALMLIDFDKIEKRYFFETSMLIQLNVIRAMAMDVPIHACYGSENSSLKVWLALVTFPGKLLKGLLHRIFWRYFIYDISTVTLFLVAGLLLFSGGTVFGIYRWILGGMEGVMQSAGTVALAFLPVILGFQMLLQAVLLDVIDRPVEPISDLVTAGAPEKKGIRSDLSQTSS